MNAIVSQNMSTVGECARTDKVKALLVSKFGDTVTFARPSARNRSELVYATGRASDIIARLHGSRTGRNADSDEDFVEEVSHSAAKVTHDQQELHSIYHAARSLRVACWGHRRTSSGLSLSDAKDCIPGMLFNFLVWLLSDMYHDVPLQRGAIDIGSRPFNRRVCSIAQDIMYCGTRVVPPKHVILGIGVHHLFRSERLVSILNRFGHSIAYSQVLEHETGMAEEKVRRGQDIDSLPDVIDSSLPFFHVVDNNDLNEETLDGKKAMHCTNAIVVQPRLQHNTEPSHPQQGEVPEQQPPRKRRRALCYEAEQIADIVCTSKVNPPRYAPLPDATL
eukprot:scpid89636/ scgid32825/ 